MNHEKALARVAPLVGRDGQGLPQSDNEALSIDAERTELAKQRDEYFATSMKRAREIADWEQREAACCPEDVGFEEWIAVLTKQRQRAHDLLAKIRGWDMLDATADGPYWRREIDRVLTNGEGDTVAVSLPALAHLQQTNAVDPTNGSDHGLTPRERTALDSPSLPEQEESEV